MFGYLNKKQIPIRAPRNTLKKCPYPRAFFGIVREDFIYSKKKKGAHFFFFKKNQENPQHYRYKSVNS